MEKARAVRTLLFFYWGHSKDFSGLLTTGVGVFVGVGVLNAGESRLADSGFLSQKLGHEQREGKMR